MVPNISLADENASVRGIDLEKEQVNSQHDKS